MRNERIFALPETVEGLLSAELINQVRDFEEHLGALEKELVCAAAKAAFHKHPQLSRISFMVRETLEDDSPISSPSSRTVDVVSEFISDEEQDHWDESVALSNTFSPLLTPRTAGFLDCLTLARAQVEQTSGVPRFPDARSMRHWVELDLK